MLKLLPLVLLLGCAVIRAPKPSDTKFKEEDRNWTSIYVHEMKIAKANNDAEAYYFFLQEIIKEEYKKKYGKELCENPSIEILK